MIPSSEVRSNLYIHSYVMDMDIRYSIWLPPAYDENESYPVLYLLHGYEQPPEDSHNCWLSKGNLDALATQYALEGGEQFLIVTPNGQNSFFRIHCGRCTSGLYGFRSPKAVQMALISYPHSQ